MSKILIIEDDENIIHLEKDYLEAGGFEVDFAVDGETGLGMALKKNNSLVLLDIMLPRLDGFEVCKRIRQVRDIPILLVSAKKEDLDKINGLGFGADDYIAKPFGMVEFVSRVRAVLRRYEKTKNKNSIFEIGKLYVDFEKHIIKVSGEAIELSYKEYKLLSVLLEADGKVVTRDELLQKVWGEFYEESRTLDVHIRKLRVKLKVAGNYIKTVKNIGYQFMGDTNE